MYYFGFINVCKYYFYSKNNIYIFSQNNHKQCCEKYIYRINIYHVYFCENPTSDYLINKVMAKYSLKTSQNSLTLVNNPKCYIFRKFRQSFPCNWRWPRFQAYHFLLQNHFNNSSNQPNQFPILQTCRLVCKITILHELVVFLKLLCRSRYI